MTRWSWTFANDVERSGNVRRETRGIAALAVTGGIVYGMNFSVLAAVLPILRTSVRFSDNELSLLSASFAVGGALLLTFGGFVADRLGRKRSLAYGTLLFLLATAIVVLKPDAMPCACGGRLMQGVGCGLIGLVLPLYLMEMARENERGRMIALFQFSMGAGALAGSCGGGLANALAESLGAVRLVFSLMTVPAVAFGGALLCAPDSPVRVASNRPWNVHGLGRSFLFVLAIMMLTQAIGPGPIQAYTVDMLSRAGFSVTQANAADMVMRGVSLSGAFAAILVVKRIGAERLLRWALAGLTLTLFVVAATAWLGQAGVLPKGSLLASLQAVGLIVSMGLFNLGPGACAWTVAAETLSPDIRARGMSVALLANSAVCVVNVALFLTVSSAVGCSVAFVTYGMTAFVYGRLVRR